MPEKGPLARAVELGGFVEVAREGIEEALEEEDRVAAGHAGQEEGGEGVEQAQFAQEDKDGNLRDHVREGHGQHQEQQDLRPGGRLEAAECVGREGIDDQRQQHGEGAVDHRVRDAAAVEEDVVQHGPEVAREELTADFRLVRAEEVGVVGELGHGFAGPAAGNEEITPARVRSV